MSLLLVGDVPSGISMQLVSILSTVSLFTYISLLDGNGDWNTDGCTLTTFNESTNVVGCQCNHLTNFACLVVSTLCKIILDYRMSLFPRTYLLECNETIQVYQRNTFWHWMSQPMLVCSALSWV